MIWEEAHGNSETTKVPFGSYSVVPFYSINDSNHTQTITKYAAMFNGDIISIVENKFVAKLVSENHFKKKVNECINMLKDE